MKKTTSDDVKRDKFFHLRGVEGEGVISGQLANTGLPEK